MKINRAWLWLGGALAGAGVALAFGVHAGSGRDGTPPRVPRRRAYGTGSDGIAARTVPPRGAHTKELMLKNVHSS